MSFDELEGAALVASGVRGEAELEACRARAEEILGRLRRDVPQAGPPQERAQALFLWLWQAKPRRYAPGGPFRLDQALLAQLDPAQEVVGNCLGLTLLYNVLASRLGLRVGAVHLEDAWGRGPHVLTLLYPGDGALDVENALLNGFAYSGHLGAPGREVWGDRELVADVYHSRGNLHFDRDEAEAALGNYEKALRLHPRYVAAHLNKGMALARLGRGEEAGRSFDQALRLSSPG